MSAGEQDTDGVDGLAPFRERLDVLDEKIARLLGERFDICREVARHKRIYSIPMMQPARIVEVRERYIARGVEVNLPPDFTTALFDLLIAASCKLEDELIAAPDATEAPQSEKHFCLDDDVAGQIGQRATETPTK